MHKRHWAIQVTQKENTTDPYIDQLLVTLSSLVGNTGQMGVSLLTVLSNHTAVVVWVLSQETFWVVVAVDVDLCQSIMSGGFFTAFMDT